MKGHKLWYYQLKKKRQAQNGFTCAKARNTKHRFNTCSNCCFNLSQKYNLNQSGIFWSASVPSPPPTERRGNLYDINPCCFLPPQIGCPDLNIIPVFIPCPTLLPTKKQTKKTLLFYPTPRNPLVVARWNFVF